MKFNRNFGKQHVCCTYIENLSVSAGKEKILNDVNLHLHCGELTCIVGRNGAGKSTFMKALLNVIPHTGNIVFEGERCTANCNKDKLQDHKKFCSCNTSERFITEKPRFGYVPQSLSVEAGSPISVEDLVLACITKRPVWLPHRKKDIEFCRSILKTTNAQELLNRRVGDLSGGELQRVMLALAINPMPDILLLDEPVSGVDRVGLQKFYDLVTEIKENYDITILLISHDLDLVAKHADRVVFINQANAKSGTVEEIFLDGDFIDVFGHIMLPSEYEKREEKASDPEGDVKNHVLTHFAKHAHTETKINLNTL